MRVHSQPTVADRPSDSRCHDHHVPSSWFLTTSTVYSAHQEQVYCNPLPVEVRRVSSVEAGALTGARAGDDAFPATRPPFEEFPSSTAVLHHCSQCPLAVTATNTGPPARAEVSVGTKPPRPRGVMTARQWSEAATSLCLPYTEQPVSSTSGPKPRHRHISITPRGDRSFETQAPRISVGHMQRTARGPRVDRTRRGRSHRALRSGRRIRLGDALIDRSRPPRHRIVRPSPK